MENPNLFLAKKYHDLNTSPEVEAAARRTTARTGEKLPPQKPEARIKNYLDRIRAIFTHGDPEVRERLIEKFKQILHDQHVIKAEEIPESYFASIIERHRQEGYGDITIPDDLRAELAETVITDQKNSLDSWVDYLGSPDAKYPDWLKYWAMRSMLKMGRYDKEKKKFTERYGGAVSAFPELNQEALSLVFDAMEKKYAGQSPDFGYDIQEDTKDNFLKLLEKENFAKLYAVAIEEFRPISEELLKVTDGQWIQYPQGSDPEPLVASLKNYGTGWCIRGEATARRYLQGAGGHDQGNDLEVFYSLDENQQPNVPRVVIVSNEGSTMEVRGIAKQENLDPHIGGVVQAKLAELPDGNEWQKKNGDMRQLTLLERKVKAREQLTKDELVFLYEIDSKIKGFGYQRDPRIKELMGQRDLKSDAAVILEREASRVALNPDEVDENTEVYIGKHFPNMFRKLTKLDHIYTVFPGEKIIQHTAEIVVGGTTVKKIERAFKRAGITMDGKASDLLHHPAFSISTKAVPTRVVELSVKGLFEHGVRIEKLFKRAVELGLQLCPPEVGPEYLLTLCGQPEERRLLVAMEAVTNKSAWREVFYLLNFQDSTQLITEEGLDFMEPRVNFLFCLPD